MCYDCLQGSFAAQEGMLNCQLCPPGMLVSNVSRDSQLSFAMQQFQIWSQLATIKAILAATRNNYI